ncbi:hypothetical protein NQ315_009969 [Exocentrus adspersus]|uniref:Uncharacterized protein n=1 Tax=Exocentrus adspersus TaxID=1586481 RepID=A0AAV8WJ61_9CUCU|nr:hypothetical protein NQ315_009969 [Exocentrus adspersus]
MPATWLNPNALLTGNLQVWTKIDDKGWKPPKLDLDKELNYFDNETQYQTLSEYDLFFSNTKVFPLWDERKPRENRQYLPDLRERIYEQEKDKPVPALTSMTYGRPCRCFYDDLETKFRRHTATKDFTRKNGVMRMVERKAV